MSKFVKLTVLTRFDEDDDDLGEQEYTINADTILHYSADTVTKTLRDQFGVIEGYTNITLKHEAAKSITDYAKSSHVNLSLKLPVFTSDSPNTLRVYNSYEDINNQLGVNAANKMCCCAKLRRHFYAYLPKFAHHLFTIPPYNLRENRNFH